MYSREDVTTACDFSFLDFLGFSLSLGSACRISGAVEGFPLLSVFSAFFLAFFSAFNRSFSALRAAWVETSSSSLMPLLIGAFSAGSASTPLAFFAFSSFFDLFTSLRSSLEGLLVAPSSLLVVPRLSFSRLRFLTSFPVA